MTACQCPPEAGFCPHHRIFKSEHLKFLCRIRQAYYDAWEAGKGPGQNAVREPRPEAEQELLKTVCSSCANLMHPTERWCWLDNVRTCPGAKERAYQARVEFPGKECEPFRAALSAVARAAG
jgi:hypothetical protein